MVRGLLASSTEVSLGVHGQKIEIDPVTQNKSHIFSKIKPVRVLTAEHHLLPEKETQKVRGSNSRTFLVS